MKCLYVGNHQDELDGGRPIGPGDEITLTDAEAKRPMAARLLDEGLLLPQGEQKKDDGKRKEGNA